MHISRMEDEYFVDNMIIYIENKKKIAKIFNYDLIIYKLKNIKKRR